MRRLSPKNSINLGMNSSIVGAFLISSFVIDVNSVIFLEIGLGDLINVCNLPTSNPFFIFTAPISVI